MAELSAKRCKISIHALCEEGDAGKVQPVPDAGYFYPRPLRGGRPRMSCTAAINGDFYPRPLRGGRHPPCGGVVPACKISIHALCEEGDLSELKKLKSVLDFYPRPLRGGRLILLSSLRQLA